MKQWLEPGRTEAQIKAEALREASDEFVSGPPEALYTSTAAAWLRDRADRIERGES